MPESRSQSASPWALCELGCWLSVLLAPILTWINGLPVSADQAVVRTVVFVVGLVGGTLLTVTRLFRGKRSAA